MILSIDAEKAFNTFLIKTFQSVRIDGTYLDIIKVIYRAHSKYHSQWGKTESFSPKVRDIAGMSTIITAVQHGARSPSISSQTTQRNKRHPNWQRSQTLTLHI